MKWTAFRGGSAYWICQLLGWSGMVFIETVNYTFFIVQRFQWRVFYLFLGCALAGLILTHAYRFIVRRQKIVTSSLYRVWLHAFLATLVIGFCMMVVTEIPYLISGQYTWQKLRVIDLVGATMNWMRYVGVWIIIYFMYQLLRLNASIRHEKLAVEHLAKATELELLKSQLNPHFLFNALNAIKALVSIDPDIARDAIVKLSELLRYTLNYGRRSTVPLREEVGEVEKYLQLEQLRFEERLQVEWEIDPALLETPFPPAILLTLAENAVKHGIAQYHEDGVIRIEIRTTGTHLVLTVWNSGAYHPGEHTGIGLAQIRQRLLALYANNAHFRVENSFGMVMAEIQIPVL